jgi:hypothetical protein
MHETLKKKIWLLPRVDRLRLANDLWDSFFLDKAKLTRPQLQFLRRRLLGYVDEGCGFMSSKDVQTKLKKVSAALSTTHLAVRKVRA